MKSLIKCFSRIKKVYAVLKLFDDSNQISIANIIFIVVYIILEINIQHFLCLIKSFGIFRLLKTII